MGRNGWFSEEKLFYKVEKRFAIIKSYNSFITIIYSIKHVAQLLKTVVS